ncbi:TPA: outer membrane protein transport protein [Pseudomonas aeruginosa]
MGISANDLCQHVIRPTLDYLSCHSPAAEALLLGAAACQSALGSALDDRRGHGLYRIASERHQQLWDQYLALDPERASRVRGLASQHAFLAAPHLELTVNLRYSTAIAWSLVEAARLPLPDQHDHLAQARVWRQATNGLLGSNGDTKINIKGDDTAIGYNVGVMVDLTDDTTWGLTYHSKVKYHLGGNTEVKNAPGALGLNGKYDAKLDITLPESVDTSITHKFDDKWTGYLGAVWTRWSRLEKIEVRNSGVPALGQALGFNTIGEDLNWRDTWSFSVGTSYQATPEWVLRTGFAYEPSPTSNEDRNVRIPVGDRKVFTVGAGWSPNQDLTVDVAYAYLWETTAGVNQEGSALQPAYSAKYDNSAHGLTAQVTYRF